mgnify:CR=1 FL=1
MNRREKRALEKRLGIRKHVKSLPLEKWAERVGSNIQDGKRRQAEFMEASRIMQAEIDDNTQQNSLSSLATELMLKEGLSYIEAIEKAKETLQKEI